MHDKNSSADGFHNTIDEEREVVESNFITFNHVQFVGQICTIVKFPGGRV